MTLICSLTLAPGSFAAGDAAAGKAKAAVCAACHGIDGNSVNPEWPSLAGQQEDFIVTQLTAFQEGRRQNVLMTPMSMGLDAQAKADIAAYYASQATKVTPVDPVFADFGKKLYFTGDKKRGIAACAACHGPTGQGNGPAGMPALSGQRAAYTITQLKAYASGDRVAPSETKTAMMNEIASMLSDADMLAVANYVQGLK